MLKAQLLRRFVGLFALGLLFVASPSRLHSQTPSDALFFFKNYFVTGDYVVGGVGLRGLGQTVPDPCLLSDPNKKRTCPERGGGSYAVGTINIGGTGPNGSPKKGGA